MSAEVVAHERVAATAGTAVSSPTTFAVLAAVRVAALALLVIVLLHDAFAAISQSIVWPLDFASYYVPAHALLYFPGVDPYNTAALGQFVAAHHLIARNFYPYIYPPVALYLFIPVAALPFDQANVIWAMLSHLAAFGSALLLADTFAEVVRRKAPSAASNSLVAKVQHLLDDTALQIGRWRAPLVPFAVCATVVLFAYPTVDTYNLGQINLLVLFFLMLAFHSHIHDRPVLAGFAIAVAGALKLTPLIFLAFFVARGAWKAVASCLAFSAIFAALPLFLLSPHIYGSLLTQLKVIDAEFVPALHNESLVGALLNLAGLFVHPGSHVLALVQQVGEPLGLVLATASIGCLILAAWRRGELTAGGPSRVARLDLDWLGFAFVTFAFILATPLLWSHAYVIALPAPLMLAVYPLVRTRQAGEGWDHRDNLVVLGALLTLALFMMELPLGADHGVAEAQNHTGQALLTLRAAGTLIAWGTLAVLLAPQLRRVRQPRSAR